MNVIDASTDSLSKPVTVLVVYVPMVWSVPMVPVVYVSIL